jgi:hypothetical protein
LNRRQQKRPLNPAECHALEHAWHQAAKVGYPLNAMITIRPQIELTPLQHAKLVNKFWNGLGVWSRRAGPFYYCILTREAEPNGKRFGFGEHFHALVHVPANKLTDLREAVIRWHPTPGEAHVRRAHQNEKQTAGGKIESALGYLTKQRTPQAWWNRPYRRKAGGIVLGKRYRITANLRVPSSCAVRRGGHRQIAKAGSAPLWSINQRSAASRSAR